jgi:hypothetical protein
MDALSTPILMDINERSARHHGYAAKAELIKIIQGSARNTIHRDGVTG